MKLRQYDAVSLQVFETRQEMGEAAAGDAAEYIRQCLRTQPEMHCIFAAAPSQNEFLAALVRQPEIAWDRIHAYHMDEYVGFGIGHPDSFNHFLTNAVFSRVPFASVHLLDGANDPAAEAKRYAALLENVEIDITFMGIGENGHIAFNDPNVADFNDPETVKCVLLDEQCRMQQVHDGCFPAIGDVPTHALTVTIPKLISAKEIFCIVPTEKKRAAVKEALTGEIAERCPASILRRASHVHMYIDRDCDWM